MPVTYVFRNDQNRTLYAVTAKSKRACYSAPEVQGLKKTASPCFDEKEAQKLAASMGCAFHPIQLFGK